MKLKATDFKTLFRTNKKTEYEVVYARHLGVEVELPTSKAELEGVKVAHQVPHQKQQLPDHIRDHS